MPDRYANGDPSNDRGGASGAALGDGLRPGGHRLVPRRRPEGPHGTCTDTRTGLARVEGPRLHGVWLAPVVVQQWVQGDSAAYHGYWGLDFTRVDPHLGTNADFAAFVDCAHRLGLKVYLDIVVNHTADVILLSGGTSYRAPEEMPYRDCKGKPYSAQRLRGRQAVPVSLRPLPAAPADRAPREAERSSDRRG